MTSYRQILFSIVCLVWVWAGYAQQRGQILKAGDSVLDPNGDGYITASGGPFSIDGYYVDEFEFKMFGLPIAGDGETDGDAQQSCSTTDLATDTTGFSSYGVLENGNLIFRFRLAGNRPSVESYTILIDTDNRIGPSDPNYTPDNPGFEVDITLIKNKSQGVFVYNIDGIDNCPTPLASYPFSTHFQSSVAGTTSCNDADYFYDFYIPFQVLTDEFGITAQTELRFMAVTNVSATCAMSGNISDVGGVNDDNYSSLEEMFVALSESQCPTAIEDLCQTCDGFKVGTTEKPDINQPVKVGESLITGTSESLANIFVSVFDGTGSLVEDLTTASDIDGNWELTLAQPLQNEDSITARAQIEGSCSSGISESDISFALVIVNTPPVISGSTGNLNYTENADPLLIFDDLSISDADDTEMDSAWVTVTANYNSSEDVITLPPGQGLDISWEPLLTRVKIFGQASLVVYESVIQGIAYSNSSDDPDLAVRSFSVMVHDGLDESNVLSRSVDITPVNDPAVLSGDASIIPYTESDTDVIIENTLVISDLDDNFFEGATISFTQGYDAVEDTLQFTDQNGITGSFDDGTGLLTLSGSASLADYQTALRSIKYENLHAGNDGVEVIDDPTTRIIVFRIDDGDDLSNVHSVSIDMDIGPNVAPIFVDNLTDKNPVDTVVMNLLEDSVLDSCLVAFDADGDPVNLQPGFSYENGVGTVVLAPSGGLCFTFTPDANYSGSEYVSFTGCDEVSSGSLCDNVVVEFNVIPVNDPPDIVDESNNPIDTVYYTATEDIADNFCIDAIDIESNTLEFAEAVSVAGNGIPTIPDPNTLCFDYVSNMDYYGNDTLRLVVCEQGSTTQCDTLVAIIEILPQNDPPVIHVGGLPVDTVYFDALEDVITQMCVTATDPDMDALEVVDANAFEGPGIFEHLPLGDLCFFFQSEKDSTGMVYGEIVVCDNASTALCDTVVVAVNVIPQNDPPVIVDEDNNPLIEPFDTLFFQVNEDEPLDFCIDAIDPDGDPVILTDAVSVDGNGIYVITDTDNLCVTFTPNMDFNGSDEGLLTVCESVGSDPQCASIIVIVEVLPVNDPPVVNDGTNAVDTLYYNTNEDEPLDICLMANDVDDVNITLDQVNILGSGGSFDLGSPDDLCTTFNPDQDFNGEVVAEVIVCDGQDPALCDSVIIVIDVLPINDPPGFTNEGIVNDTLSITTLEDVEVAFCLGIDDPDGNFTSNPTVSSTTNLGDYSLNVDAEYCFVFAPFAEINGIEYATVEICDDDGACSSVVIEIVIVPVNDPPVGQADAYEHDIYTSFSGDLAANDMDPEGTRLQVTLADGSGLHGNLELSSNGEFVYTPSRGFVGKEEFTYQLCDEGDPVACVLVTVTFELNDPLIVWQAVSPNGDNMNDVWIIEGIDLFPDNRVQVFDRYSNLIFEIDGYNNQDKVWFGQSNRGLFSDEASDGTYFYKIDLGDEKVSKPLSGFIILKVN